MRNQYYRVNLDKVGSWIWLHCDGQHSVKEIAEGLNEEFGTEVEPVNDRVTVFFRRLARGHFVTFRERASLIKEADTAGQSDDMPPLSM